MKFGPDEPEQIVRICLAIVTMRMQSDSTRYFDTVAYHCNIKIQTTYLNAYRLDGSYCECQLSGKDLGLESWV